MNLVKQPFYTLFILATVIGLVYPVIQDSCNDTPADKTQPTKVTKSAPKQNTSISPYVQNIHLPDFSQYRDVKEKKRAFFSFLYPFATELNQEIIDNRAFILSGSFNPGNSTSILFSPL